MAWIGAVVNAATGRRDNYFNKSEADRARDWSKGMSNTEIQRRVADMKAAGINPMLAVGAGGGASTPGSQSASAAGGNSPAAGYAAWSAAQVNKAVVEKTNAETAYINQNSAKVAAETKALEAVLPYSAKNAEVGSLKLDREFQLLGEELEKRGFEKSLSRMTVEQQEKLMPLALKYQDLVNQGLRLGLSEKEAEAKFFEQIDEGSKWLQLIKDLLMGIRAMERR